MAEKIKEHEAILKALEGQHPDEAEAAARPHPREARAHAVELRVTKELAGESV